MDAHFVIMFCVESPLMLKSIASSDRHLIRSGIASVHIIQVDLSKENPTSLIIQSSVEANKYAAHPQSKQLSHSHSSGNIVPPTAPKPNRVSVGQMVKSATTSVLDDGERGQKAPAPPTQTRNELREKFRMMKKQIYPAFKPYVDRKPHQSQESSDDDRSDEDDDDDEREDGNETQVVGIRKQDPELLLEVETFDSSALGKATVVKKNLQPVSV